MFLSIFFSWGEDFKGAICKSFSFKTSKNDPKIPTECEERIDLTLWGVAEISVGQVTFKMQYITYI